MQEPEPASEAEASVLYQLGMSAFERGNLGLR